MVSVHLEGASAVSQTDRLVVSTSTGFPVSSAYAPAFSTPALDRARSNQQQQQQPRQLRQGKGQHLQQPWMDNSWWRTRRPQPPCDWGLMPKPEPVLGPSSVRPVHRVNPRRVQECREHQAPLKILFVEDGNQCRCPPLPLPTQTHAPCKLPWGCAPLQQ